MADETVEVIEPKLSEPFKEPPKPRKKQTKAPTLTPGEIPPEIPEELPKNINFNNDNEKSHTALSVVFAQFLYFGSFVGAAVSKQNAWLMHDDEALGIAMPAMAGLMRLGWFRAAVAAYGQYAVGLSDMFPLFIACFSYYERVQKELDREPKRRGDAYGPKQADAGRVEPVGSNGLGPLASIPTFGREA